jgi:hypothetical protein
VPGPSVDADEEYTTPVVRPEFVATFNRIDVVSEQRARIDAPASVTAPRTVYMSVGDAAAAAGRNASCHPSVFNAVAGVVPNDTEPVDPADAWMPLVATTPTACVAVARVVHVPGTVTLFDEDPTVSPPTTNAFATVVVIDGTTFGVGFAWFAVPATFSGDVVSTPRNLAHATDPTVAADMTIATADVDDDVAFHRNTVRCRSAVVSSALLIATVRLPRAVPPTVVMLVLSRCATITTNQSSAATPASGVNDHDAVELEKGVVPAPS